ncbi:MAG: retroviral-like aspartic protease family protein [Treponema sp.]|nr:retroviral-like aspartic protease family protein [Treponema sp.]
MADFAAFTYRVPDNHRYSIVIDIDVCVPVPIQGYPQDRKMPLKAKALIDTGASRSAIRSNFIQAAKLASYEKCTIRMAKGEYVSSVYTVDILFPNQMMAKNIKAAEFSGNHEFDFIMGMDILRMVDMAITNARGVTVLSLRSPPAETHIDFTRQTNDSGNPA